MATYSDTLKFLYSQLPMYQRVGAPAFKKGLGNTRALLKALGNPEKSYPAIHIAGTNGKGTVSHLIASCYQEKGLRVGLYTSPHYRDFRERVKINGAMISKREVTAFVDRIKPVLATIQPSFFEITVALAFDAFARHKVDIAVVETGLGGRLDSTNVITPLLSVITNISYDHMAMLGNTLTAIAGEKAGIIKKTVPVVIGEYQPVPAAVFRRVAKRRSAKLVFADRTLRVKLLSRSLTESLFSVSRGGQMQIKRLRVASASPFLLHNLTTALHAINVLGEHNDGLKVEDPELRRGVRFFRRNTAYVGRWQVLGKEPLVLADSAHNRAGLEMTMRHIRHLLKGELLVVFGLVTDKNAREMLALLPKNARIYAVKPDVPRGMDVEILSGHARQLGFDVRKYASVRRGLAAARKVAQADDLVFVGGSSFVVAEVV